MKKHLLLSAMLLLSCFHILKAGENKGSKNNSGNRKTNLTGCAPATAQIDLDIANVRATILNGGDMWWNLTTAAYEVPKGSGKHSLFAGALWIGGIDPGGQIRTACQTYRQTFRQTGSDYWPGPIDPATGDITAANCLTYDRVWKLNKSDVADFVNTGTTTVQDIIDYPGNNPYENTPLAPYFDKNNDGVYNYLDGDYPYFNLASGTPDCCDILHGEQSLWWVINDVGNLHADSNALPIGIEIRCQAYAFDATHKQTINTTFYQYYD